MYLLSDREYLWQPYCSWIWSWFTEFAEFRESHLGKTQIIKNVTIVGATNCQMLCCRFRTVKLTFSFNIIQNKSFFLAKTWQINQLKYIYSKSTQIWSPQTLYLVFDLTHKSRYLTDPFSLPISCFFQAALPSLIDGSFDITLRQTIRQILPYAAARIINGTIYMATVNQVM